MVVEQLIGLQAAIGELGELYLAAKGFRALRAAAENQLLLRTAALAAQLRHAVRQGNFGAALADATAREIAALRQDWQERLDRLRASPPYQQCLHAWFADDTATLAALLPDLIADLVLTTAAPPLYWGVSLTAGRRHGGRPFVAASACAATIIRYRNEGVPAEADDGDWWDTEIGSITLVDDAQALDTPITLRLMPAELRLPVFCLSDSGIYRVYAKVLKAPFTVRLQPEVTDEWWQAFPEPYAAWRAAVAAELAGRGIGVEMIEQKASHD